jgi:hypothetical protein
MTTPRAPTKPAVKMASRVRKITVEDLPGDVINPSLDTYVRAIRRHDCVKGRVILAKRNLENAEMELEKCRKVLGQTNDEFNSSIEFLSKSQKEYFDEMKKVAVEIAATVD